MSSRSYPPYLRLVETPALDEPRANMDPRVGAAHGALLGFVDMSRTTDVALETIIARLQPAWVFDLRPVPYFEIGRINRKHIFALFRISHTTYRDVAGHLRIRRRHDASLNSGAVASFLNQTMSSHAHGAPVVVLVDDEDTLQHAMEVLPLALRSPAAEWFAAALDVDLRRGDPDVVLRTTSGELVGLQATHVAPG